MDVLKRTISILDKKNKKYLIYLFFIIIIGVFLETLGIGIILPIITIIIEDNILEKYSFLDPIIGYLGYPNKINLLNISLSILFFVFLIKNIFLVYLNWQKAKCGRNIHRNLSKRLLEIYFKKPYKFHLNKNSSELINNVLNETSHASVGYFLSIVDIIVEVLFLLSVLTLLLFIEPIITIISFLTFFVIGYAYQKIMKKKLVELGVERKKLATLQLKSLREILENIKLITLFNKKKKFVHEYSDIFKKGNLNFLKSDLVQQVPRLFYELVIIILFSLIIVVFSIIKNGNISEILPVLAIYGVATFKILPSVNKILLRVNNLGFTKVAFDLIYNEFKDEKKLLKYDDNNIQTIEFKNLNLKNVSFSYSDRSKKIFNNISLELNKGKIYGFVGSTGEGKSTLMDIIMGFQKIDQGEIYLNNMRLDDDLRKKWIKSIGYVPQNIMLLDNTIRNNVAFGDFEDEINEEKLKNSLKYAQLENFCNSLEEGIQTLIGENGVRLSGGQRQRIGIARALYLNPQILILDEITSSLDSHTEDQIMKEINELKQYKTVLIITHRISTTKFCDEIYEIKKKTITKV